MVHLMPPPSLVVLHRGVLAGYEAAARVAKKAHAEDIPLREAAVQLGVISGEEFDKHVDPYKMLEPT